MIRNKKIKKNLDPSKKHQLEQINNKSRIIIKFVHLAYLRREKE